MLFRCHNLSPTVETCHFLSSPSPEDVWSILVRQQFNMETGNNCELFHVKTTLPSPFFKRWESCFDANYGTIKILSSLNAASFNLMLPSIFGYGLLVLHIKQMQKYMELMLPSLSMHLL